MEAEFVVMLESAKVSFRSVLGFQNDLTFKITRFMVFRVALLNAVEFLLFFSLLGSPFIAIIVVIVKVCRKRRLRHKLIVLD